MKNTVEEAVVENNAEGQSKEQELQQVLYGQEFLNIMLLTQYTGVWCL